MRLDRSIEPFVILYHIEQSIIALNIEKGTEVSKIPTYLNILKLLNEQLTKYV